MTAKQNNSKTKIAFVTNVGYSLFSPEVKETYGGGQIDLYLLAQEFKKTSHYDVSMLFLDHGQPTEEIIDGIRLIKTYRPHQSGRRLVRQFIIACWRVWRGLRKANADIYFHEGAEFEIAITRVYCFFYRRKLVFRCANIIDVDGRYQLANPIHGRLFSFGLAGAQQIIAQTKDQKRLLDAKNKPAVIIENVYPHNESSATKENQITIWVGRMTKVKRPDLFLLLAERFPDNHFLMLGPVDTVDIEYANSIQQRVKNISNLQYIEKVPFQKTSEIFGQAKLLVNTSEYEGFPLTFVQAMCHGIPILTMGIDPDHVVSSVAGLVANNTEDLLAKYQQLQQPAIWKKYSRASFEYTEKHFAPQMIVPKYEKIFQDILAK